MHNVNILTIHKEPNYGAVLQAYALYKTIENLGHVPYIINLDMDYSRFPYSLKYRVLLGLHKWMIVLRWRSDSAGSIVPIR